MTRFVVLYILSLTATEYARVAQWWSIALPRRGSRVRIPSRALKKITKRMSLRISFLLFFESNPGLEVRMSPLRFGPCKTEVPQTSCTVSRSQENNKKDVLTDILFVIFRVQSRTRSSNVSASLRSVQNRGPPDLVHRLALN